MAGPRTVDMSAAANPGEHGQDGWLRSAGDEGEGRCGHLPRGPQALSSREAPEKTRTVS